MLCPVTNQSVTALHVPRTYSESVPERVFKMPDGTHRKMTHFEHSTQKCPFSFLIYKSRYRDPITGKTETFDLDTPVEVPCGKCPTCLENRVQSWAFRLTQEYNQSNYSQFLTLTYDETHINSQRELVLRDFQLFLKRLRKRVSGRGIKIRYYAIGEYGPTTQRPHYHCILFSDGEVSISDLQCSWDRGFLTCSDVTSGRIGYVSRWHSGGKNTFPAGLAKPFFAVSKCNGIGFGFKRELQSHLDSGNPVSGLRNSSGYPINVPRYYQGLTSELSDSSLLERSRAITAFKHSPDYIHRVKQSFLKFDSQRK